MLQCHYKAAHLPSNTISSMHAFSIRGKLTIVGHGMLSMVLFGKLHLPGGRTLACDQKRPNRILSLASDIIALKSHV